MTTVRDYLFEGIAKLADGDWPRAEYGMNRDEVGQLFSRAWHLVSGSTNWDNQGIAYNALAEFTINLCRDIQDDTLTVQIVFTHASNWDLMQTWLKLASQDLLGERWKDEIIAKASPVGDDFLEPGNLPDDITYRTKLYPLLAEWIESWAAALVAASAARCIRIPAERIPKNARYDY